MEDRDLRRIEQAIENGFKASGRSNVNDRRPPADGDASSIANSITNGLSKAFKISSDLTGRAIDQTLTINDTASKVSSVLEEFGAVGGVAGTMLTGLTDVLVQAVENWQYFSNFGLQFGGDALALNEAVKKTGLSFSQYRDLVDKAIPAFANFGQGLSIGAERFGDASQQLQTKYGQQLARLGMNFKDINDVLAITARGVINIDTSAAGIDNLNKSAVQLARELDKTSQLSGKSRKAQEEQIQALQDEAKIQALMARLMRENPEKATDINKAIEAAGGLDSETGKLMVELIASNGVALTESLSEFSANSSAEMASRLQQIAMGIRSDSATERVANIEAIKRLPTDIALERGKAGSNSQLVEIGSVNDKFTQAMYGANSPYNTILRNLLPYIKQAGGNEALARELQLADINRNAEARLNAPLKDKDGNVIAGVGDKNPLTATTEIVTNINTSIKSIGTSLNTLLTDINKQVTTQRDKDNKLIIQEVVRATSIETKTPSGNRYTDIQQRVSSAIEEISSTAKKENRTANFEDLMNLLKKEGLVTDPKANPAQPAAAPATAPVPVAPSSSSSSINTPGMNVLANMATINTRVSSATAAEVNTDNTSVQVAGLNLVQDKLVEKLGEISIIMARVEQHTKNTAIYSQDTATNIKDVGPYA